MRILEYIIPANRNGVTVGWFLRNDCGLSRRLVTSLKHHPLGITANGKHIRTVDILNEDDLLAIRMEGSYTAVQPADILLSVLYEDDDIIIIDKPANMPMHPTHGHLTDTLANAYAAYAGKKGEPTSFRPVGRLDRNTTGIVVACKNSLAANALQAKNTGFMPKFQNQIKKTYLAICEGELYGEGTINAPIRRKEGFGIRREIGDGGQSCVTHWQSRTIIKSKNGEAKSKADSGVTLVEIWLETGRTHQIRTHFAEFLKTPLCGDDMYGGHLDRIVRHALHCAKVEFTHPITGQKLVFRADLPEDMAEIVSSE